MQRARWWRLSAGAVVVALLPAAVAGCGSDDNDSAGRTATLVEAPTTATVAAPSRTVPKPRPKPRPKPQTVEARLAALDANVARGTTVNELLLTAKAPKGAFDGTTEDLNLRAGRIFRAVYLGQKVTRGTVVVFRGALANPPNGGPALPSDSVLAIYNIRGNQAREIAWTSEDSLQLTDWTEYLLTLHPALR